MSKAGKAFWFGLSTAVAAGVAIFCAPVAAPALAITALKIAMAGGAIVATGGAIIEVRENETLRRENEALGNERNRLQIVNVEHKNILEGIANQLDRVQLPNPEEDFEVVEEEEEAVNEEGVRVLLNEPRVLGNEPEEDVEAQFNGGNMQPEQPEEREQPNLNERLIAAREKLNNIQAAIQRYKDDINTANKLNKKGKFKLQLLLAAIDMKVKPVMDDAKKLEQQHNVDKSQLKNQLEKAKQDLQAANINLGTLQSEQREVNLEHAEEIQKLRQEQATLKEQLKVENEKLKKAGRDRTQSVNALKRMNQILEVNLSQLQKQLDEANQTLGDAEREYKAKERELEEVSQTLDQQEDLQQKLSDAKQEVASTQAERDELQSKLSLLQTEHAVLKEELTTARTKESSAKPLLEEKQRQLKELTEKQTALKQELEKANTKLALAENERNEHQQELTKTNHALQKRVGALDIDLVNARAKIREAEIGHTEAANNFQTKVAILEQEKSILDKQLLQATKAKKKAIRERDFIRAKLEKIETLGDVAGDHRNPASSASNDDSIDPQPSSSQPQKKDSSSKKEGYEEYMQLMQGARECMEKSSYWEAFFKYKKARIYYKDEFKKAKWPVKQSRRNSSGALPGIFSRKKPKDIKAPIEVKDKEELIDQMYEVLLKIAEENQNVSALFKLLKAVSRITKFNREKLRQQMFEIFKRTVSNNRRENDYYDTMRCIIFSPKVWDVNKILSEFGLTKEDIKTFLLNILNEACEKYKKKEINKSEIKALRKKIISILEKTLADDIETTKKMDSKNGLEDVHFYKKKLKPIINEINDMISKTKNEASESDVKKPSQPETKNILNKDIINYLKKGLERKTELERLNDDGQLDESLRDEYEQYQTLYNGFTKNGLLANENIREIDFSEALIPQSLVGKTPSKELGENLSPALPLPAAGGNIPSPPPPPAAGGNIPPPPPPPPQAGTSGKKNKAQPGSSGSSKKTERSLLDSITAFSKQLNKVKEGEDHVSQKSEPDSKNAIANEGIASILARRIAVSPSDSDDDGSPEFDAEEDDWDDEDDFTKEESSSDEPKNT